MAKRQVPTKPTARPVGRDKDTAYLEGSISATREAALCHNHASDSNYDEQGHWLNPGLVWKAAVAMELFCVMLLTVWLEATGASNVSLANIEGGTENANAELWMRTHLPKAQVKALGLKEKAGFANVYAVVSGCVPSAGATSVSLFIVLSCFGCRVAALICALAWSLVLMDLGLVMTTGAHMTLSLLQFCASQAWVSRETFAMNINIALGMLLGGNIVNAAISLAKVSGTHLVIMICMRRAYRTVRSSRTAKRFIATILAAVVVVEFGVIAVTSLAIVETHDFRKATTAPLFGVNRKCKPSNALLSIGAEAWAAAFSSSTDSLWTETSQFGEVFLPRPHRSVAGSKGAPRVVHQQDNKPFDDGGPVGVVLLLLESTRASSFSGLHEDVAADYTRDPRDASLAPPRPSFISKLAHFPGSRAARFAFPTMPNTNKVLWEGLTGLTPLLETSWDEFNTNGPYWSSLKKECLPRRLSEDLNWDTLFANPVMSTSGSVQQLLGFEKVAFRDTLFKECRADLISREPSCERIVFQLDDDCLNFMVKACRKKKCLKASIGDSLRSVFLKHAAAAAQAGSKSLQTQTSNESINDNNCGGWFGDPLTISQVNTCFDSPCLFGVHLRGELSSRLRPDRLMFSDYLLAIPALNFAKNSIRNNRNFFITLLTTAAHHPYAHQGLKTPLIQSINESHDERLQYASAVDQGDILASTIFNGLKEAGIGNRTLFIVAGDHGEAFGEGGHRQHGSCLQADCIRVPFVVHDPVAGSARHKEFRQLSATETAHHLTPSRRRLAAGVTPDKLNGSINWMHGLTSSADIVPTVLAWAGLELQGSAASGTILRRGRSLLAPRHSGGGGSGSSGCGGRSSAISNVTGHTFLRSYAFFNPQVGSVFTLAHPFDGCGDNASSSTGTKARSSFVSSDASTGSSERPERPAIEQFLVEVASTRMSRALFEEPVSARRAAAAARGGWATRAEKPALDTQATEPSGARAEVGVGIARVVSVGNDASDAPRCTDPPLRAAYARATFKDSQAQTMDLAGFRLSVRLHYDQLFRKSAEL